MIKKVDHVTMIVKDLDAALKSFEEFVKAINPIFGTPNDPLLTPPITRSGPGVAPLFELKHLEEIFRHKVFKMPLSKEKMTQSPPFWSLTAHPGSSRKIGRV